MGPERVEGDIGDSRAPGMQRLSRAHCKQHSDLAGTRTGEAPAPLLRSSWAGSSPGLSLPCHSHQPFSTALPTASGYTGTKERRDPKPSDHSQALLNHRANNGAVLSGATMVVSSAGLWDRAHGPGGHPRCRLFRPRSFSGRAGRLTGCFPNFCMISLILARLVLLRVKSHFVAPMS